MNVYLKSVRHPKMNSMWKVKVNRFKLKWKTVDNVKDSGVFAMRHMETYKGETVSRYDSGFVKESASQELQLNKIRVKYVAKMLLSKWNVLRTKVVMKAMDAAPTPTSGPIIEPAPLKVTRGFVKDRHAGKVIIR